MTESTPDPSCPRRRKQSAIDVAVSVVLTLLLWPFPVARALSPCAHAVALLVSCAIVHLAYYATSATVWRQTLGMRLTDLRLVAPDDGPPRRAEAIRWGILSGAIALWYVLAPVSACRAGVPERLSGTAIVLADEAPDQEYRT